MWYLSLLVFLDKGFEYEPYLSNGCSDLMQKAMNFNVAIASVKESAYRVHFWYFSKDYAINSMKKSDLNEKRGLL